MAVRTVRSEIPGVDVIGAVAAVAVRRPLLVFADPLHMASVAGNVRVSAVQRELRFTAVVESNLSPGRRGMAGPALLTEAARVDVFVGMTSGTGFRQLPFARRLPMAGATARLGVGARERKSAFAQMVETFFLPGRGRVAIGAVLAEASCMRVIDGVTGDAILGRVLVSFGDMTSLTARFLVRAGQRIRGLLVIEASRLPFDLVVAVAAILRKSALVGVVAAVAIDAFSRRVAPLYIGKMALRAFRRFVPSTQGVVRLGMIEGALAECSDVRVTALVVGVAGPALPRRRQRIETVKAPSVVEVVRHFIVTDEAQGALRIDVERLVTGRAFLLELFMACDQRPRHHHALPIDGSGGSSDGRRKQACDQDLGCDSAPH